MTLAARSIPVAVSAALLLSCAESERVAGNSANTGNAQAVGRVLHASGAPATGAWITCRPDSLPPWGPIHPGWTTSTDADGRFSCSDLPAGPTSVLARDPASGTSVWNLVQLRADLTDSVPSDTLAPPGAMVVALAPRSSGTLYFTGLDLAIPVRPDQGEILVPDLPHGWSGEVRLARTLRIDTLISRSRTIRSGRTDSAGYTRDSALFTVPLDGGLSSALLDFPVLLRLDSSWVGFDRALPDGSDLRLSRPDGRLLPLALAEWDPNIRSGALWTLLDTLDAPGDSVDLVLSWGIPLPRSVPPSPFATSKGWVSAWGLGDSSTTIRDWTGNFPGSAQGLGRTRGVVGHASSFDGRTSFVDIPGSTTGALDFPVGGPYTISCWARLTDFATSRFLIGQGDGDYFIKFQKDWTVQSLWSAENSWYAKNHRSAPDGGRYSLAPADTARWTHLSMVVRDSLVSLFVDGVPADSSSLWDPDASGKRSNPFRIGASTDSVGLPAKHFLGSIDEVWAQAAARSPDWIRMTFANQRPGAAVLLPRRR
ncbi:MAG: hypothetical protein H6686_03800 [Fibrobacteria bacterium]|nr:hypothetical protein [Fibrobacteria bacterium]